MHPLAAEVKSNAAGVLTTSSDVQDVIHPEVIDDWSISNRSTQHIQLIRNNMYVITPIEHRAAVRGEKPSAPGVKAKRSVLISLEAIASTLSTLYIVNAK